MSATSKEDEVVWHDAENWSYDADLTLWRELARAAGGPVLDLGCGTGRVALDLARRGSRVMGIDIEPGFTAVLNERAQNQGLDASAKQGDLRRIDASACFPLVIVPMQTIQLLTDADERREVLGGVREHLEPRGLAAMAIVQGDLGVGAPGFELVQPMPDLKEVDGWVYSSLPLDVEVAEGRIVISRLRQLVSPDGDLTEERNQVSLAILEAEELEAEAVEAGLSPAGRRPIPETDSHVAATVVLLERAS